LSSSGIGGDGERGFSELDGTAAAVRDGRRVGAELPAAGLDRIPKPEEHPLGVARSADQGPAVAAGFAKE
jgi:hypothetical protein